MLDVQRLRVLREVAARGSFSAAAEALHYTQSAVSQQIAALEREAGMPPGGAQRARRAAHRRGRGAGPPHATRSSRAWPTRRPSSRRSPACAAAALRLATFATRGRHDRAGRRSRASASATRASSSRSCPRSRRTALEQLRAGEVDVALTDRRAVRARDRRRRSTACTLLDDPMYVCLPRAHPLARKRAPAPRGPRRRRRGCSARPARARTRRSSCARASARASSRGSPSTPTTTSPSRASSPPAWASRFIPDLALVTVRDDVVIRELTPRAAVAADRRRHARRRATARRRPRRCSRSSSRSASEFQSGARELALAV